MLICKTKDFLDTNYFHSIANIYEVNMYNKLLVESEYITCMPFLHGVEFKLIIGWSCTYYIYIMKGKKYIHIRIYVYQSEHKL